MSVQVYRGAGRRGTRDAKADGHGPLRCPVLGGFGAVLGRHDDGASVDNCALGVKTGARTQEVGALWIPCGGPVGCCSRGRDTLQRFLSS